MSSFTKILSALLLALVVGLPFSASASDGSKTWDFSVLLDGNEIGYHRFELVENGATRRVTSEAKFDVRFLFINAFRYRHSNTEVWSNGCLRELDAQTQADGKKLAVKGYEVRDKFVVDDGQEESVFADCVMTFAYWNPEFLRQEKLLNAQSGEYLDVDVKEIGREPITVRGREVDASVYTLTAKKLNLTLWYSSKDDEWLALESVAKGGRIIRYELT